MKFVGVDLGGRRIIKKDVYGGGGGEDFRGRRKYDGDEVEAVKLFLTSGDGVAAALGFEESSSERQRPSGVNEVRKGGGVFIATVKTVRPKILGRTCP